MLQVTTLARKSHYSATEKGVALAMLDFFNGNVARTARVLNIPRKTLDDWSKQHTSDAEEVGEERQIRRNNIVEKIEEVLVAYFEAAKIKAHEPTTSFYHLNGGIGILLDKWILLHGRPNIISATLSGPMPPTKTQRPG